MCGGAGRWGEDCTKGKLGMMSKQTDRDIALVSNALAIKQAEIDKLKVHLKNCIIFLDKIGIDPIKVKADGIDMLYFGEDILSGKTRAYLKRFSGEGNEE